MDNHEHLVENVISFVQRKGCYELCISNPGKYRKYIPCSDLVTDNELKWLFHMANYVVYGATNWQETGEPNIFREGYDAGFVSKTPIKWKKVGIFGLHVVCYIVGVVLGCIICKGVL